MAPQRHIRFGRALTLSIRSWAKAVRNHPSSFQPTSATATGLKWVGKKTGGCVLL
ncbi:MAG: hypothetical protein OSA21_02915 [Candidatus Poseidoniaceae archaeon]|nr:hypothetical protein [Candidatus Poseidoniaceae archaeon]